MPGSSSDLAANKSGMTMSAIAQISGRLCGRPETKLAKNGFLVTFFKLKTGAFFWECSAVSQKARD
jgi:hypothetical protein